MYIHLSINLVILNVESNDAEARNILFSSFKFFNFNNVTMISLYLYVHF